MRKTLIIAALAATVALPSIASAQIVPAFPSEAAAQAERSTTVHADRRHSEQRSSVGEVAQPPFFYPF